MVEREENVIELPGLREQRLHIMQEFLLTTQDARPGDDLAAIARQLGIQTGQCIEAQPNTAQDADD